MFLPHLVPFLHIATVQDLKNWYFTYQTKFRDNLLTVGYPIKLDSTQKLQTSVRMSSWIFFAHFMSKLVICSRNRVPGPGSKIHNPFPNPGNWYPFLHRLLMKNAILACLCISLCDDFDFPLFATIVTTFVDVRIQIWSSVWKNIDLWKIFGNWVCTCYRIIVFPYFLKSWNRVRIPG